jgi:hypothetical protein
MNYKNQQTSTNPPAPVNGGIEEEKAELLQKCYLLLQKIANRPYGIKLLLSAIHALETIAGYKSDRKYKRNSESKSQILSIPKNPQK